MLWFLLALCSALSNSFESLFNKLSTKTVPEEVVLFVNATVASFVLWVAVLTVGIPPLKPGVWWVLVASVALNGVATFLYIRALKLADLSLAKPLITLTPLFLLLTAPLIIGEVPSPLGIVGVVLIVMGAYTLNIHARTQGVLAPFRALINNKGARLMFVVAALWSLTSVVDKLGTNRSSYFFWPAAVFSGIAVVMAAVLFVRRTPVAPHIKATWRTLAPLGLFTAGAGAFQMAAYGLTQVTYVISVKRLSVLFGVIWGWLFLHEQNIHERLAGAAIMATGVILIALS